jgi:hypothetical protein
VYKLRDKADKPPLKCGGLFIFFHQGNALYKVQHLYPDARGVKGREAKLRKGLEKLGAVTSDI